MFIFERPQKDFTGSFAGGIASFGELFDAVVQQMGVVENLNAVQMALEDAYDVRIDAIFAATGVRIEHPFRQNDVGESEMPLGGERQNEMDAFEQSRARLAAQFPQHAEVIGAGSSIRAEADAISVAAEDRTNLLVSSRDDFFVKWGAILAGGIIGSFRDPVQAATLVFGGGPGAGRTIAARVLNVAAKEFAVNVGIEAALQPIVQKYRADLGLEHGFADAARQVAFAGVLGAAFGSVVQGGVEVVSRVGRQRAIARQFSAAANELPETSPFAEIDTLSGQATSSLLEPVRVAINAEGRGAIDLIDAERAFDDYRVAGVNAEEFDLAAAAGIRFAENPNDTPRVADFEFEPSDIEAAGYHRLPETVEPGADDLPQTVIPGAERATDADLAQRGSDRPLEPKADQKAPDEALFSDDAGQSDVVGKAAKKADPELRMNKFPVINMLRRLGGVEPKSTLAGELRNMGITSRTHRGLFKVGGRSAADNIVARKNELFETAADDNGFVPEETILAAIADELAGAPLRTPEQAAAITAFRGVTRQAGELKDVLAEVEAVTGFADQALAEDVLVRMGAGETFDEALDAIMGGGEIPVGTVLDADGNASPRMVGLREALGEARRDEELAELLDFCRF